MYVFYITGYGRRSRKVLDTFLSKVGFQSAAAADSLYDMIIETPANYLKYYVGYGYPSWARVVYSSSGE